jgi:hypothetical protein
MRGMFNELMLVERAKTGEIEEVVIHSGIPTADKGLPDGSQTQMVSYREKSGVELARAHRFLLPDGSIGASGKPDPKRLLKDGILYRLRKSEAGE